MCRFRQLESEKIGGFLNDIFDDIEHTLQHSGVWCFSVLF